MTKVHSELRIVAGTRDANRQHSGNARDFGDFVDDATITAGVKSELETLPAGGDVLALIGAVFVVLLILELTGVINIFKGA